MSETSQEYRIYYGPNLEAPFAAAIVEFAPDFAVRLPTTDLRKALRELLPPELKLTIAWPDTPLYLAELAALLANGFQDLRGPNSLPHHATMRDGGRWRVVIGFCNDDAAVMALRGAVGLAHAVFALASGLQADRRRLGPFLSQTAAMSNYQPDYIARALIRAARKRGIPVVPLASGTAMWVYGEGKFAVQFSEAATHRDSQIGMRLSGDKFRMAELLRSLGLPATDQMLVHAPQHAVQAARRLGYPVVIKPIRGSKGRGVSIGLKDDAAVTAAFAKARGDNSSEPVLVERLVEGDDLRLSVFGGHLLRASRLVPPHVIGDGIATVSQLIEAENRSRSDADVASGLLVRLTLDSEMVALIRDQGFGLSDVPPAGRRVLLRRNSNLATGGKLEDVTEELHPDNRIMAETIARVLHLDAVGIDFMTTDPALSWRESKAAVIEVNATPGIGDVLAERIIAQKFKGDGRVPAILILDGAPDTARSIAGWLKDKGLQVGETGPDGTRLGSEQRFIAEAPLPARIRALLLDPACEALVVRALPGEVAQSGLPYAKFGLAIVAGPDALAADVDTLIVTHAGRVLRGTGDRSTLAAAVEDLLRAGAGA
ncbi:MAG: acetate--CoA ligase family protein [Rhizobiales bacterium]|nr:acetate--CoA ligase family protein [Hyphomicrobiales bacterium]